MVATLCVLGCVLATGQAARPSLPTTPPVGESLLSVRFERGQELVYRGAFTETDGAAGVQCERAYRVEVRVLALDASPKGADVAFLTVLKPQLPTTAKSPVNVPTSVRMEVARVDSAGRLAPDDGVSLLAPLEGPPTAECGAFLPLPAHRVGEAQPWKAFEEGRPLRTWEVVANEAVNGQSCLKLVGVQKSSDWEQPRGDRLAWKRTDTVWLSPRSGFAHRVERIIEKREPAAAQPVSKSVLRYELAPSLPYPRQLAEDCRLEVRQAHDFAAAAKPLLVRPAKAGTQLDMLLGRIKHHLEATPPTPYRDAVVQVQKQIEAAQRGELPAPIVTAKYVEEMPPASADSGSSAPEFIAPSFTSGKPEHFRNFRGKPVVMVFYHPASMTAAELLTFAQGIQSAGKNAVTVLGLAMCDDAKKVLAQREELQLSFPLLDGTGLRKTYAIDATPKVIVIDADGVVRAGWTGWGRETPGAVSAEVRRWLAAPK